MIYWLHRLGAPLGRALPLWFCYGVASISACVVFIVWAEKRTNAIENMRRVLGPDADDRRARTLALRAFMNYAKYMIDMLRLEEANLDDVERRLTITGWEHF